MHRYDGYLGVALLAAIALIVVLAVGLATRPTVAPKQTKIDWIYGEKQVSPTSDPHMFVYCQAKTNSVPFINHAVVPSGGEVAIVTCRAVKRP
jgi:hypothetical protein